MTAENRIIDLRIVLTVDDLDAALRLYRDGLGLALVRSFPGGAILSAGPATLELLSREESASVDAIEGADAPSGPARLAIQATDSVAAAGALVRAGARPAGAPVTTPWGHRSVRVTTPEGLAITLFTATDG